MKIYQNIILLVAIWASVALPAQNDLLRVRNFGIEDGLSQRDIFKVQQDSKGFLWITTKNSLDRYDGHQFHPWYQGDQKSFLPSGVRYDMLIGPDDEIWLSRGNALIRINPQDPRPDTMELLPQSGDIAWFNGLCQDEQGRVWTTKYTGKDSTSTLHFRDKNGLSEPIAELPGKHSHHPVTSANGHVHVGAYENEIWVYDLTGKQVSQFEFPAPTNDQRYSRVVQLKTGPDGTVWALLAHGQLYYQPANTTSFIRHPISESGFDHFLPSAFMVESTGDIWIGGLVSNDHNKDEGSPCSSFQPGAALLHYNGISNRIEDYSYFLKQALPYAEAPRQIFMDQTGVIWISTTFGLIRLVENNLFERYMSDGNDCCRDGVCSMRGITEDDQGNIYFSYYSSIHVLNPRNGSLVALFPDQLSYPYIILHDRGHLYTGEGLRINLRSLDVDTVAFGMANTEGVVMKDRDGAIWFGCQKKLKYFDPDDLTITDYHEPTGLLDQSGFEHITYLHPSNHRPQFWVATREQGIFKTHKKRGVLAHYHTESEPALPHNRILAVLEKNNFLWIASAVGLCKLDLELDSIRVYTTEDGLTNNFINGLLPEGDSAIWVSTDNGLSRLDIQTGTFSNFYKADGLSNNEFNRSSFHVSADGHMYFGGIDGINAFYPNSRYGERKTKMNSHLLFTKFTKFDGEKDVTQMTGLANGSPISLSHSDETFSFYYSLGDFTDPKMHLYSFKLEGFNNDWSDPTPLNFARFVNVPPGKYTFRARAARAKGDWVKQELAIPVLIRQAFYKTGWFRIVAFAIVTLLVYAFMRYRLYLVEKHEHELELLVQDRTRELVTAKAKSDELLLNILPADTAEELKQNGSAKARRHDDVTVMFTDFKGFSFIARNLEPEALVAEIDHCFRAFDEIIEEFGLEKIKTIGDAYLCGSGLHGEEKTDAAVRVVKAALKIQCFLSEYSKERNAQQRPCFPARIGIHSGPVVAGIVGIKKFAYDIWGDTVNIAERLQSSGKVGKVNISKSTHALVKNHFHCDYRGKIEAKHQGEIDMYFVEDRLGQINDKT